MVPNALIIGGNMIKSLFETEKCSRCGGGGSYSYNAVDGSRCYGCGGSGIRLTRRGKIAATLLADSQKKPVSEIKPGMYVWEDSFGMKARWLPIISVSESESSAIVDGVAIPYTEIRTKRGGFCVFPGSKVRCIVDESERQALIAAALDHQSTLK
jgi:hypothetical protein